MRVEDRIQALKRSPAYRKDYEKYDAYRRKNNIEDCFLHDYLAPLCKVSIKGQELCRKYKIPYPYNPDGKIEILPNADNEAEVQSGSKFKSLEKGIKIPSVLPIPILNASDGKQVFGLVDNQYLKITIDLSRPQSVILQDIAKLCQYYKTQIDTKKRDKDSSLDCWEIYDQVKEQSKKNLLRIAKSKYKFTENPAYCEKAASHNERVKRAYAKAQRLIQEFEVSS